MAKTQAIEIPDELGHLFDQTYEPGDRHVYGVIQAHKSVLSRERKAQIKESSLFGFLSNFWRLLEPGDKELWREAGAPNNLTNWQLFISDNAARIRNDLELAQPPSVLWQVRTGFLSIEAPADTLILKQIHPQSYWTQQRVRGKPWRRELVLVEESASLPLSVGLSYKSELTPVGSEQKARFYAKVWSSYQGRDIETEVGFDLDAETDWKKETDSISEVRGFLIGYDLMIEIVGYRGIILIDNIEAIHSGQNWARDPRCDAIDKEFTKAFSIVKPFWIPVAQPAGASYSVVFPPAL